MDARTRAEGTNVDARKKLAAWLRAGRDRRNLTIEDVAKITKIQPRILEKLEAGSFEGLPAEVFVKGFVRSFAKCVGLDESEAIDRYTAAQAEGALTVAKALVDTMAPTSVRRIQTRVEASSPAITVPAIEPEPAPALAAPGRAHTAEPVQTEAPAAADAPVAEAAPAASASPIVEAVAAVATAARGEGKKKRSRKNAKQRARKRKQQQELAAAAAKSAPVPAANEATNEATNEPATQTASASSALAAEPQHDAVVEAPQRSIDTAPVAKLDATSPDVAIEAKTTEPLDGVRTDGTVEAPSLAEGSQRISQVVATVETPDEPATATSDTTAASADDPTEDAATASTGTWQPTMPPIAATPSVPWRRPSLPTTTASTYVVPSLVIDDADPESADREREARNAKEPQRLSFLPPILLDREDRSARQGGLTLAVIILLIAATLTLSYLMRRPSPSGDGVTMLDESSMLVG